MKNKKPIIGIVGYIEKINEKTYITVDEFFRESIIISGGIPILILPTQHLYYDTSIAPSKIARLTEEEKKDIETIVDLCDGILFPGGNYWYQFSEYIFDLANEKNKSILGICIGMQLMVGAINRKYGDGTYKNIKNETKIDHLNIPSNQYVHSVIFKDNTKIEKIFDCKEIKVNSRHGYHIGNVNEYTISGYSEDGIPESIELPNKEFVIGVQWHPERLIHKDENSKKIFKEFVDSCKN